jgi:hypothetical protein
LNVSPVTLKCTRSTDYNKSATIIGKFENINSSELVDVLVSASSSQSLTGGVATKINLNTIARDNGGNFNTSTNTFTSPKDTCYAVSGVARYSTGSASDMFAQLGGTIAQAVGLLGNRGSTSGNFASVVSNPVVCMSQGETLTLLAYNGVTRNSEANSFLAIKELPDTESIIKNLSNQKTKCQTKYLSANVTATGIVSDLTFNNLSIGKKYQMTFYAKLRSTVAAHTTSVIEFEDSAGVDVVPMMRTLLSFSGINQDNWLTFNHSLFIASNSVFRVNVANISGVRLEAGTYLQLCELPDTYVDTNEW